MKFSKLDLSKTMLKALETMQFKEMTPIQEAAIPLLQSNKDLIGQADTGTGKTAAFAIPTIEALNPDSQDIQALVLCPTRELCCQVAQQFNELMRYHKGFKCLPIYGGQKINIQLKALKHKPQVVIGTPGRILDHIRRGSLKLRATRTVILDEADLMLGMGFKNDIESILRNTKGRKQTVLFSATMQKDILQLARKHQKKAEHINLKTNKGNTKPNIKQSYYRVEPKLRKEAIKRLLCFHGVKSALIFCNTRVQVDKLCSTLKEEGFSVAKLHGELKQNRRDAVMHKFREGKTKILVATDVAARGIDVDDIGAVFNYNLPRDSQDYIHRIGRTGRAGKTGLAFDFINSKELSNLKRIANKYKLSLNKESIPPMQALDFGSVQALEKVLLEGTLSKRTGKQHLKLINTIKEDQQEEQDVIHSYIKSLKQRDNSIFGVGV